MTNSTTNATGHVEFTGLCGYRFDVSVIFPDCTSAQLMANQLVAPAPTATDAKAESKKMIEGRKAAETTKEATTKAATTKEATTKEAMTSAASVTKSKSTAKND